MRGERVWVWLNGKLVVDGVVLENYWDRSRPIFAKEQIELQCHGDPIEWRNVFIRHLPVATIAPERVGVCSWSWKKSLRDVAAEMEKAGVNGVHLALGPFIHADERHGSAESAEVLDFIKAKLKTGQWKLMGTMIGTIGEDYSTLETIKATGGIVPDKHWQANQALVSKGAKLSQELGAKYMSLHAGFLDESDKVAYEKYVSRIKWMRDECAKYGIQLILESGQETAEDLAKFLKDVPGVGINFDPANMILYGKGDPMKALKTLMPWIVQVHVKDALYTKKPGTWGVEVPWGEGWSGGRSFITELEKLGYRGNYVVEREGGSDRAGDIRLAVERLVK
jgi:sugar phosphate isomerase/epimerase